MAQRPAAPAAPEPEIATPTSLEEAVQTFNKTLAKQKSAAISVPRDLLSDDQLTVDRVLEFGKRVVSEWKPSGSDKRLKTVNKFLKSLQAYGPVIEVFIRPVPAVKSIIWGGIKFILSIGTTYLDRLEDLAKVFEDLSDWLPIASIYQRRAAQSKDIQRAVELFQEGLVQFLTVLVENPAGARLVHTILPGFNPIKATRDKLERAARNTAAIVTAIEQDLQDKAREEQKRLSFLEWLDPHPTTPTLYAQAKRFKLPKAFASIFESECFGQWFEAGPQGSDTPANKVLHIKGSTSCGKSTLAAAFTDQIPVLLDSQDSLFCPVFLDGSLSWTWGRDEKLCAVLHEIFRLKPEVLSSEMIGKYYKPAESFLSDVGSQNLFKEVAARFSTLYILIDGLEFRSACSFCDQVCRLFRKQEQSCVLRIIVFRDNAPHEIGAGSKAPVETDDSVSYFLEIDWNALREELRSFVQDNAARLALQITDEIDTAQFAIDVKNALMKDEHTNFHLVQLAIDYIEQQPSVYDARMALNSLSPNTRDMYMKILMRISAYQDGRTYLAVETIKALLSSFRPMSFEELAVLVGLQTALGAPDEGRRYRGQSFGADVQKLCGPLVRVSQGAARISTMATKEFLRRLLFKASGNQVKFTIEDFGSPSSGDNFIIARKRFLAYASKDSITRKCISYLSSAYFSDQESTLPALGDKLGWVTRFPLFDYASNCWLNHLFDLADHMKNPFVGDPNTRGREELWFDQDLLSMLATFLGSSNTWTYLEGLLLFSSARETRETLFLNRRPIAETEDWISLGKERVRPNQPNARILEDWALGLDDFLSEVEDLGVEDALQVIRQSRREQIEGTGMSLLDRGNALKKEGRRIGQVGGGSGTHDR